MNIALLTVPFNNNYGGFLQAFALKTFLESKGHNVTIINRKRNWQRKNNRQKVKLIVKKLAYFFLRIKSTNISLYTDKFVEEYLSPMSKEIYTNEELNNITGYDFYIVGSDQVWRYIYAPENISNYFFDFLKGTNKPRISYAASFGVSFNEYDKYTIERCSNLLKEFNAISVRESSGISLLKNVFSVNSKIYHVLDPTMLIDKNVYIELTQKYPSPNQGKYILTYILDKTEDKNKLINKISAEKKIPVKNIDAQTGNNKSVIEPVEKWLSYILNASYVITDSFHGMIFSIIFNKPFIVYINKDRGAERFESLLSLLNLQNRLIDNSELYKDNTFNWEIINKLIHIHKEESIKFLENSLI